MNAETRLTRFQSDVIDGLIRHQGDFRKAAKAAGSKAKDPVQAVWSVLSVPHARVELLERAQVSLQASLFPKALETLSQLLSAKSENVRLQAAKDVLDRVGFKSPDRSEVTVRGGVRIDLRSPLERASDGTRSGNDSHRARPLKTEGPTSSIPQSPTISHEGFDPDSGRSSIVVEGDFFVDPPSEPPSGGEASEEDR